MKEITITTRTQDCYKTTKSEYNEMEWGVLFVGYELSTTDKRAQYKIPWENIDNIEVTV